MKHYKLFIDESGTSEPKHIESSYYVLCGCVINALNRDEIKIAADQIKFKYWSDTKVIFHSKEIARNEGEYSIFKDNESLRDEFIKDLFTLLRKSPINLLMIIVDKQIARKKGWNQIKVVEETSRNIIFDFIVFLLSNTNYRGSIIIESAGSWKDAYYLKDFDYFLSPTCSKRNGFDHTEVRKALTSLSFVTKHNHDIEEQLADIFAYAGKCKYQKEFLKMKFRVGSYEEKLISILDKKLMNLVEPRKQKERKVRLFKKVKPFCVLPK